jgi:hypothetical protein
MRPVEDGPANTRACCFMLHDMDTLRLVLLLIHILGFAALFGGLVIQAREPEKRILSAMRDGAGTAFLAGLGLVGVLESGAETVNHAKIGVKFIIGLVILALVMMNRHKPQIPNRLYYVLLALVVTNIAVAVFWAPAHA